MDYKRAYHDHDSSSIQTYMMKKNILFDKDDYTQIEKQESNLVKIIINRLGEINNHRKEIKEILLMIKQTISLDKEMSSSSILNQKSFSSLRKYKYISIRSNPSPMSIYRFCGRTYDRSTSAYTSKKRSHRSMPTNIFSHIAKKTNQNDVKLKNNRSSNTSNIYLKLSDCQTACRHWTAKYHKQNQSNHFSSHARSHYRHRKRKLSVCYRDFPFSLNALSRDNNTQKQYINRCHIKSTNHQLISQMKSKKDIQTKISVDIRKVSCMDMDLNDGNEDERDADSSESIETDDESSVDNVSKQFSNSTLASAHMLIAENDCHTCIDLEMLLLDESVSCLLCQSPLQAITVFDIKSASIITFIYCVMRTSIIQLPSLSSIILESDATRLWQYQLPLNIKLIDSISDVQNDQKIVLDDDAHDKSSISKSFIKHESQSHQDSNGEENSRNHHVIEPLSSTNQLTLEKKLSTSNSKDGQSMTLSNPWNGSDLLSQNHELDYSTTKITEKLDPQFSVNEASNHDLKSSVKITSDLFIDQSYSIATIHEIDEQDIVPSLKSSGISLISDHFNDRSVFEEEDIDKIENQLKENDEEITTKAHQFFDNIQVPFDETMPSLIESNDLQLEIHDDASQLQHVHIDSSISIVSIDTTPKRIVLAKKSPSLDELHITVPRCVHLCDPFEQMIHRKSDTLLSTATKQSTLQKSPHIDIYQNEEDSLKRTLSYRSKTHSSDLKNPQLLATSLSNKRTSSDNTNLQSAYDSSEPSLSIQQSNQQSKSTEKLKTSRIMTIPRKTIDDLIPDNDSSSIHQQKKYYVKNQFSDVQLDKLSLDTSSPKPKKRLKRNQKTKLAVISTKCARRQKLIRPSWISPTTTTYPFKRSFSFQQLRDPCQILEVYTRFKRIHCKPYRYICTPLPSCFC